MFNNYRRMRGPGYGPRPVPHWSTRAAVGLATGRYGRQLQSGAALAAGIVSSKAAYMLGARNPSRSSGVASKDPSNDSGSKKYIAKKKQSKKPKVPKGRLAKLEQSVKNLSLDAKSGQGLLDYRGRTSGTARSTVVGSKLYQSGGGISVTDIETILAQLQFYDPATPGTLVTSNASSGTYSRKVHFKSVYQRCLLRNNYQVPCKVRLYHLTVKTDTSLTPDSCYAQVADSLINGTDGSPLVRLRDSTLLMDLWKVDSSSSQVLQPGDEMVASHSIKPFDYDPSITDSHALTYQTDIKSGIWFIFIEGCLGHDTSAAQYGLTLGGVDILYDNQFKISYDAGIDLHRIYIADTSAATFTNGGVVSSKPVSDNIGYSVA